MVGFIIPFRSKESSNNWPYHSALLNRTIKSLVNQDDPDFQIFVVITDYPLNVFEHAKVKYVKYPYPFLKWHEIADFEDYASKYYSERYAEYAMDQGRRVLYGASLAINAGCKYIMSVDADDLLSNKIVSYVHSNSENNTIPGWYIEKGYVYIEGKKYLYRQNRDMKYLNGSTNMVRADLIPMPDFTSHNLVDYNFFAAHGWVWERLYNEGVHMKQFPFFALIYSMNNVSWTSAMRQYVGRSIFKRILKFLLKTQPISGAIKNEFGFYYIDKIEMRGVHS